MNFKLGELFCGPGGLALGAGLARKISKNGETFSLSHVWGVDKDVAAIETYKHNIVKRYGGAGECMDAMEFCKNQLSNHRRITALAFGFPCNDFSLVGEWKGMQGKYGNLYKAGIKAIEKCNPYWFIAENVSGIHYANSGEAFKKILRELENSGKYGYKLTTHLYKFEHYGVPQYRHRYIVVGIRKDQNKKFKVPQPTHGGELKSFVTAREACENISTLAANSEVPVQKPRVILRLKFTGPWKNAWHLDKLLSIPVDERRKFLKDLPWYEEEFAEMSDKEIAQQIDFARLKCKKARMQITLVVN